MPPQESSSLAFAQRLSHLRNHDSHSLIATVPISFLLSASLKASSRVGGRRNLPSFSFSFQCRRLSCVCAQVEQRPRWLWKILVSRGGCRCLVTVYLGYLVWQLIQNCFDHVYWRQTSKCPLTLEHYCFGSFLHFSVAFGLSSCLFSVASLTSSWSADLRVL